MKILLLIIILFFCSSACAGPMDYTKKFTCVTQSGGDYIDGYIRDLDAGHWDSDMSLVVGWVETTYTNPTTYDRRRTYLSSSTINCGYFTRVDMGYRTGNVVAKAGTGTDLEIYADPDGIGAALDTGDWGTFATKAVDGLDETTWAPAVQTWVEFQLDLNTQYTFINQDGNTDFELRGEIENDAANSMQVKINTMDSTSDPYIKLTYTPELPYIDAINGGHFRKGYYGIWQIF